MRPGPKDPDVTVHGPTTGPAGAMRSEAAGPWPPGVRRGKVVASG